MKFQLTNISGVFLFIVGLAALSFGQIAYSEDQFRAFDAKGNPVTMDQIIKAIGDVDAVFLGEQHDDAVAHAIQAEIFKRTIEQYGAKRRVALSMEMFERDTQIVVNEYLNGQITEAQFLASSRPWGNYKTDYRPLLPDPCVSAVPGIGNPGIIEGRVFQARALLMSLFAAHKVRVQHGESVEHFLAHVHRQHGGEYEVHHIDHPLARGQFDSGHGSTCWLWNMKADTRHGVTQTIKRRSEGCKRPNV